MKRLILHRFYWPNHHALPFGEPETLTKLCNVLTANDIDIAKLVPGTYFSDNQARVLPTVPNIEEQQVNFMIDHPDAAQGTFLELFSHYFPFFSKEANILPDLVGYLQFCAVTGLTSDKSISENTFVLCSNSMFHV